MIDVYNSISSLVFKITGEKICYGEPPDVFYPKIERALRKSYSDSLDSAIDTHISSALKSIKYDHLE